MGSITLLDWTIWLVYLTLIIVVAFVYRTTKKEEVYKFFITGLIVKILGGLAFALIYVYYYKFGDTFLYFRGASILADTFTSNFGVFIDLLMSEGNALPPELYEYTNTIQYSNASEEWFMIKLLSPLALISFHSYLTTTLLVSTLSFIGSWKLFQVLRDITPNYDKFTFFAAFLIPSVLFWGGGIMKDTVTLFSINLLIYCIYFSIFKKNYKPILMIGAVVYFLIIFWLKAYIVLAFIPALMIGLNSMLAKRLGKSFLKYIIGSIVLAISIGVLLFLPSILGNYSKKYQVEALQYRVKGFHTWHSDIGGSTYNLGEIDYTLPGVIRKIPAALNVTFFRPYLWEVSNPVVGIAALESLGFLVFTILALFRLRFKVRMIFSEPIILTLLVYCLLFGFVVGFTSYNFGALGRYKIPIFSIFAFLVFYLNVKSNASWLKKYTTNKDQVETS